MRLKVMSDAMDNLILPLGDLEEVGMLPGDELDVTEHADGSWTVVKVKTVEKQWVLVETISQFRQRYMCEVENGRVKDALDTVTAEEAKEFSQQHLGEVIASHRVVSKEDALKLFDQDNSYLASWDELTKIKSAFTHIVDLPANK